MIRGNFHFSDTANVAFVKVGSSTEYDKSIASAVYTPTLTLMMISRALGISVAELLRGLERRVEEGRRRAAR